ncbi:MULTISPECIES: hypothetical protein [unclassified Shimia]|uniref:hypothetical protein n=1 Tax=unclassified Shimia TaxID=2630038 RepID=UPI0031033F5A
MHCTHLSVWILPKNRGDAAVAGTAHVKQRAGAFLLASCNDADFAITPKSANNLNRRLWPFNLPDHPKRKARQ